jgi:hypothetical protein
MAKFFGAPFVAQFHGSACSRKSWMWPDDRHQHRRILLPVDRQL